MLHDANSYDGTMRSAIDMVWAAARANPDAIALSSNHGKMTYAELMAAVDGLAQTLIATGVDCDVPVGICLERSFDYVIAILAASTAGGAFLPLDPTWPEERLRFALADARAPVLVTRSQHLDDPRWEIILPRAEARPERDWHNRPHAALGPGNLAYIIYTSGSTGEPKGVEITHANLLGLVAWHLDAFQVTAHDRASCVAGLGFDAAVWEIWPYLCSGASLFLPDESVRTSSDALRTWLIENQITVAFVPTPLAEPMIATSWPSGTALRYLLTGGDTLHTRPIAGLPFAVVNNYGPSECTVVATSGIVEPGSDGGIPTIGHPISETQIRIVDETGAPVSPGELGEIHIGGVGVGRGYRHRPDLTSEKFVTDAATRFYRTGDLGRWLPNGEIAFHGRRDTQIKLRGYRIELDEISAALDRHPSVAQSAVLGIGEEGELRLIAYVVTKSAAALRASELRDFLVAHIPNYMLPSLFVSVSSLPLTASGKLDRAALPAPSDVNTLTDDVSREPATPTEAKLAAIMAELLKIERVGMDDNFFLLGGHSLLATQLVLRARDAFGAELSLRDLFHAQTVAKLAAKIEQRILERIEQLSDEEASQLLAG